MLRMENIKKTYPGFMLDCSLEVRPGRVTGLIGQNGAGKSTAFKAVLGLIHRDGGSVKLFGKEREALTAGDRQRLGVVLSDAGFSGYLTVKDITYILQNMYADYNNDRFLAGCCDFQLPLDKRLKDFSTGMRAKLKLLIAMSHRAELLILDEPTVGLDVTARDGLLSMLRDYMEEENRAILISSHISSDLEGLCDDFYMIHEGSIILHEDTDVLLSDYAILKLNPKQFETLDKRYILKSKKESYGYRCLTGEKRFYMENYPEAVLEKGTMDDLILMMTGRDVL